MVAYTQMLIEFQFVTPSLKGKLLHAINVFNGEMNHSLSPSINYKLSKWFCIPQARFRYVTPTKH